MTSAITRTESAMLVAPNLGDDDVVDISSNLDPRSKRLRA